VECRPDGIGVFIVSKVINGPVSLKGRIFPFSQAVVAKGFVFVSGQLALGSHGDMVGETIGEQTEQVIANITAVLKEAGASLADVVKTTIWITRKGDFAGFNEVYARYFMSTTPARATVCSDLMIPGALVEIEAIALVTEGCESARAGV
jgi:2-iminobutanoate/2-iminopropanoate deaminase